METAGEDWTPSRISLSQVPSRDRIAVFQEVLGPKLVGMEYSPVSDVPPVAELTARSLPGLQVVTGAAGRTVNRRTRKLLADGRDGFGLAIVVDGASWSVSAQGRQQTEDTTVACLSSMAEPSIAASAQVSRILALTLSRSALAERVRHVDDLTLRPISADNQALRLLRVYLRELDREDMIAADGLRYLVSSHVHDLVALAIAEEKPASDLWLGSGETAARAVELKRFIVRNLHRHDLTVHAVATRFGVTVRQIQRLFESERQTFSSFLLEVRLTEARRRLVDRSRPNEKIAMVAIDCGFGDLSYFNRAFRRTFGLTPSEARRSAV